MRHSAAAPAVALSPIHASSVDRARDERAGCDRGRGRVRPGRHALAQLACHEPETAGFSTMDHPRSPRAGPQIASDRVRLAHLVVKSAVSGADAPLRPTWRRGLQHGAAVAHLAVAYRLDVDEPLAWVLPLDPAADEDEDDAMRARWRRRACPSGARSQETAHSCAGISRHEEGDESSLHRRSSDLRWPRVMRWRLRGCRRSVGRGRAGWAIEPRNQCDRGADAVNGSGRQHRWRRYREPLVDSARSENLGMYVDPHAREPGGPMTARQWRWLPAAGREGNAEAVIP